VYPRKVGERRVPVRAAPLAVLAVHDLGLVRVQLQPQTLQPFGERGPYLSGLPLGRTVHHRIVCIPLEFHGREFPGEEHIERIMQK
jgi:hypothetical protein